MTAASPTEPSPFLLLHELSTGLPMLVRRSPVERVDAARSPRGLEAAVFVRGIPEPIRVREQADDVACALGAFTNKCRMCGCSMPGTGRFGGFCDGCIARAEKAFA